MRDPYWRRARLERVVDGDTVQMVIDLGFYTYVEHRMRLLGLNTPEMHDPNPAVRAKAQEAKTFTTTWLAEHASHAESDVDFPCFIRTEKADSFGRFLAYVECAESHSLNDALLASNLAEVYKG